ncbi:MAG: sigma-E processing peptidase SpoIIGA [Oscillospiraceae bacterium]|nr:sigma-E processing peptidase SpoIIGA [Oscillospiraceae bacterium]
MTVYLDSYFLINLTIDYLSLYCAGLLCGTYARRARLLLSALTGALYSCAALLISHPLTAGIQTKALSVLLMIVIGFGFRQELPRLCTAFFVISFLLGGICSALGIDRTLPIMLISTSVAVGVKSMFSGSMRGAAAGGYSDITIINGDRCVKLRALRDTGATIKDPVTGMGVLIVSPEAVSALFEKRAANILTHCDPADPAAAICSLTALGLRFRLIPYRAVGVDRGLLLAFKPEKIVVDKRTRENLIIALSPNQISDNGAYSALLRVS